MRAKKIKGFPKIVEEIFGKRKSGARLFAGCFAVIKGFKILVKDSWL